MLTILSVVCILRKIVFSILHFNKLCQMKNSPAIPNESRYGYLLKRAHQLHRKATNSFIEWFIKEAIKKNPLITYEKKQRIFYSPNSSRIIFAFNVKETVTEQGLADWIKSREIMKEAHIITLKKKNKII